MSLACVSIVAILILMLLSVHRSAAISSHVHLPSLNGVHTLQFSCLTAGSKMWVCTFGGATGVVAAATATRAKRTMNEGDIVGCSANLP